VIASNFGMPPSPHHTKTYSQDTSEHNEDVELFLKDLMKNKEIEENKFFNVAGGDDYETLSNLRMKRMRESIESPVFGSKADSYQSQRNIIRGLTMTSKDELEHAAPRLPPDQLFKKQLRHFSFNESENSSFPSSYHASSIKRQESLNSNNTSNSNRTSNFKALQIQRKSGSSGKNSSGYKNPIGFKNHLKSIAQIVGADKNVLPLPQDSPYHVNFMNFNCCR
jgi:hypothetical protein